MRMFSAVCCLTVLMALSTIAKAEDGFVPLFDGQTLAGWQGDSSFWSVEDGAIVGSSDAKKVPHNTFLATTKSYKNFVLKVQFKLRNHNSGVQVRSEQRPDYVVAGYQADIAEKRFMGILYEERGRGILVDVNPAEVAKHVKPDDWNEYTITCNGPNLKFELNGYTTVDYTEKSDKGAKNGVIAFQLHAGPAMKVWFRNVQLKELP